MSDSGSEAGNYKVNQLGCVREESGTEKMVGKSDLVRAIPDTVIKEKALIIYPDFSEGAIDKPQRMVCFTEECQLGLRSKLWILAGAEGC